MSFVPALAAPLAALAIAAPPPTQPVALPPALIALEQKMASVRVSTERIATSATVTDQDVSDFVLPLTGGRGLSATTTQEAGSVRISPVEARLHGRFGRVPIEQRWIGRTDYLRVPLLAKLDRGRPWISKRSPPAGASPLGAVSAPGPHGLGFPRLLALLADADSVEQLGATSIDGVAVERFRVQLDVAGLPELTADQREYLQRRATSVELEADFASSGRPVRVVRIERSSKQLTTFTTEVPAINFPLARVRPPSRRQTISAAAAAKLPRGPI